MRNVLMAGERETLVLNIELQILYRECVIAFTILGDYLSCWTRCGRSEAYASKNTLCGDWVKIGFAEYKVLLCFIIIDG
jgi:hypothetical protein